MEEQHDMTAEEMRIAEKDFNLRLDKASEPIRNAYYDFLRDEQLRSAKENRGKLTTVSLETRSRLLFFATDGRDAKFVQKALKMRRDFEANTKGGRRPMGGAVDD